MHAREYDVVNNETDRVQEPASERRNNNGRNDRPPPKVSYNMRERVRLNGRSVLLPGTVFRVAPKPFVRFVKRPRFTEPDRCSFVQNECPRNRTLFGSPVEKQNPVQLPDGYN